MIADALLSRLENVRPAGFNKWVARCPSHKSKSGKSLAIKVADNETVLVHCHGGCPTAEVVGAIGLELSDLFPPREPDVHSSRPRVSPLTPLIAAFEKDLIIVHLFLADVGNGKTISAVDRMTAKGAAARIWTALREARHVH